MNSYSTFAIFLVTSMLPHVASADELSAQPVVVELSPAVARPSISIKPDDGPLPDDRAAKLLAEDARLSERTSTDRTWSPVSYARKAPAVAHQPLYFQEEHLERYGHHHGAFQPVVSAAKFFGRIPLTPYMVGATPCHECQYTLGYYRPGDCVPLHKMHPKRSLRGAVYQAAAVTGAVFVIP